MGRVERKQTIAKIEKARGSRVICYLTSDRPNADAKIQKDVMPLFFDHLRQIGKVDRIDLLLFTTGGDTLAAFGIGRLLREFCSHLSVLVPLRCHSAGTLLALGANEIVMTRGATLSPIDPSITGPLNPFVEVAPGQVQLVPLSVETVASFKELVVADWGMKGEDALVAAFRMLAEKVHPMALGDVFRARQQIEHLARKLLNSHRSDDIQGIITTLTKDLGSHDYLISRTEARTLLGSQVAEDGEEIEALVWDLFKDFSHEMQLRESYDALLAVRAARDRGEVGPVRLMQRLAVIEASDARDVAEKQIVLTEIVQQLPQLVSQQPQMAALLQAVQGKRAVQQEVVSAGWNHYTD